MLPESPTPAIRKFRRAGLAVTSGRKQRAKPVNSPPGRSVVERLAGSGFMSQGGAEDSEILRGGIPQYDSDVVLFVWDGSCCGDSSSGRPLSGGDITKSEPATALIIWDIGGFKRLGEWPSGVIPRSDTTAAAAAAETGPKNFFFRRRRLRRAESQEVDLRNLCVFPSPPSYPRPWLWPRREKKAERREGRGRPTAAAEGVKQGIGCGSSKGSV